MKATISIMKYAVVCIFTMSTTSLISQHQFNLQKAATVNVSDIQTDFFPQVIYHGEVSDGQKSGDHGYLSGIKDKVEKRFPRKLDQTSDLKLRGPGPQIVQGFEGIKGSLGIPLDNHLAVSDNGDVITVANFHFVTYDKEGTLTSAISLIQMTRDLNLPDFRYDPRVIYDRQSDKFILAMLHSSAADRTKIILGFSETNDPTGNWNFYLIEGNPFGINIFSDYPMLGLTNDKFYFTVNAVDVDKTWQEGFVETYIWEMDKEEGYVGGDINATMYNEILYEGRPIRNLCPVTMAQSQLIDKQYFLSNRNFAIENDTIFLVTLDQGNYSVRILKADVPYGVPPNAIQNNSLKLQTNDARILDAYLLDGYVEFVGNCVNPDNGLAVIYHGRIDDIETSDSVQGAVVSYNDLELGYPDISYSGLFDGDRHSTIVVSHVGEGRFPGVSAFEYDGIGYSDLVTLHEGTGVINRIGGEVQRWGDYAGNQRIYNLPGYCWTVSSYGTNGMEYGVYINQLARSDINVSTREVKAIPHSIYPNPARDWVDIEFTITSNDRISIDIHDLNGRLMEHLVEMTPKKQGDATFRVSLDDLPSGTYVVTAQTEQAILFSQRVIVR